jgi:hypothetical protein
MFQIVIRFPAFTALNPTDHDWLQTERIFAVFKPCIIVTLAPLQGAIFSWAFLKRWLSSFEVNLIR